MLATLAAFPLSATGTPGVSVRITAVDPAPGTELATGETLYLRIRYDSDQPLRFQARVPAGGSARGAMMNPAPVYPSGQGEALAWIAFREPRRLDQVNVVVFDERWQRLDVQAKPVDISWYATGAGGHRPAGWTRELSDHQQSMTRTQVTPAQDSGGDLLILLMGWSVPGYFILQFLAWRLQERRWRIAGRLPLAVAVPLLLWTLFALMAGSTLWPLMLLFVAPFLFLYLAGLLLLRWFTNRWEWAG
ncbi:MAG: hypothetical protein LAT50_11335 [Ectothiorhodospiraceae bacterium]|nr:hypothetical protein [Ectothiorhodospiraceae bacterium]